MIVFQEHRFKHNVLKMNISRTYYPLPDNLQKMFLFNKRFNLTLKKEQSMEPVELQRFSLGMKKNGFAKLVGA